MKLPRRRFLHLTAGAVVLSAGSRGARAQAYPARPVRLIVGLAPGGGVDIVARIIGQWLSEHLGQTFVIENRPGAGGNIAMELVAKAPADGYTLLEVASVNTINATLYDNSNFKFLRDIAPVASIVRSPLVLVVNPSFPAKTVPELIAYAKANPGKISMASSGIGTPLHVAGELFCMMAGIDMVHVPYRGAAPAHIDLIAGRVQVMFSDTSSIEHIRAGKLRALAVSTAARSEALPDVPVVGDFVAGYEASLWQGMGAPANTPVEIIDKINSTINACLADPAKKAQLADLGYTVFPSSPAAFGKFLADDTEKWARVVKFANIKPE